MIAPPRESAVLLGASHAAVLGAGLATRLPAVARLGPTEGGGDEWFTAWRSLQALFERGNPGDFMHPALFYDAGAAVYGAVYANGRATGAYRDAADFMAAFAAHEGQFLKMIQYAAAVFAVLAASATFEFGRRLFGARAGLFAAMLILATPLLGDASRRVRVDSLCAAVSALAGAAACGAYAKGRARDYVAAGLAAGLAASANYPGALVLAPLAWAHASASRAGLGAPAIERRPRLWGALACATLAFLATNPHMVFRPATAWRDFAFQAGMAARAHPGVANDGAGFYLRELAAQSAPFAALAAAGCAWFVARGRGMARAAAVFALGYLALFSALETKFARYALPALPWLCVLAAGALDAVWVRAASWRPGPRAAARASIALVAAAALAIAARAATPWLYPALSGRDAQGRGPLQSYVLSRASARPTRAWLEADVLPLLQVAYADPGGRASALLREGLARAHPGLSLSAVKGERIERVAGFDLALLEPGTGVDLVVTCGRHAREADAPRPELAAQRTFYRTALARGRPVASAEGCWVLRMPSR